MSKELKEAIKHIKKDIQSCNDLIEINKNNNGSCKYYYERIKKWETVLQALENSIPKQYIQEKIKELKEQRRLLGFKTYLKREHMLNDDRAIACEISVLEELLEGK